MPEIHERTVGRVMALNKRLYPDIPHVAKKRRGWRLRRDSQTSVRYSERVNSSKRSFSLQRTDRYGIVGQERCHFQLNS